MDRTKTNAFASILATLRKIELPWFILVALLISTLVTAFQNARQIRADADARFEEMANAEKRAILRHFRDIEDLMQGTLAFMAALPVTQQSNWDTYLEARMRTTERFIGLVGMQISFPGKVGASAEITLTKKIPRGESEQKSSNWKDIPEIAMAIDVADKGRQTVISQSIKAIDGFQSIPSPIALVMIADTTVPAKSHLIGIIDLRLMMSKIDSGTPNPVAIELFDGERRVYAPADLVVSGSAPEMSTHVPIDFGGRQLHLRVSSTPTLEGKLRNNTPRTILLIGVLGTLLLGGLIWLLTRLREQAESLAASMTKKLQDQTTFTENLIEFNPSPIFRKDAEGRMVSVNRAWEHLSGRKREDILGKTYRDFQHADFAEQHENLDRKLLASETGYEMAEAFITNADGKKFETIIAKQVLKNSDGRVEGLIGTITDVTPIKRLEHELAQQREQLNLVIRSSQQGIWDLDLTPGGARYYSPRFWEILGFAVNEIPANFNPETIIHPDDHAGFRAEMLRHFKGETPLFDLESRVRSKLGKYLWVRTRAIAQRDVDKRAVRFVGSIADVTDRKQAEIELVDANVRVTQAARAKEAFLATMSHEIRTPLNGVLGMTNLLAETDLNDEQRDHLRLIHASGDTLLRLIDDVLDFSKIESGHMTLESVPVEVVMVAEEAIELVADKARLKDLALLFDMDENVPFYILGDATRLRQIFLNLLANAIKFTASGEIKLLMTAHNKGDGTIVLEGRVRDTGIGIPADRADKLFQPFTQVDASTTRKYGGTGLGLAICKRLTALMGGDIRVESREGEGSEFIFTILTAAAEGPMKPYMQRNVAAFAGKRALIVDRDASRRAIQLTRNAGWGLESVAVAPPEAAATFRRGPRFDILLTDLVLPSPEAFELQAALLEDDTQRKALDVPLVASILRSTVSRAELAARIVVPPIRHDFFIMRPAGRARVFEILMRAAHHEPNQDVATRPYVPEPDYKRAAGIANRSGSIASAPAAFALQRPVPGVAHGRSLNVLVAEDNEVNQRVIHGNLNKLGHRATIVGDGRRAVEEALHGKFDVILMDIHMPELDGLAAMHEIRAQLKGDVCPPIIAITAHALSGDREHYLDAGMDDYLSKPIRAAELVKVLRQIQNRATGSQGNPLDSIAKHAFKQPIVASEVRPDPRLIDTQILDLEQLEDLRYLTPPPDPSNPTIDPEADPVGGLIRLFQRKALERMTLMEGMLARGEWVPLAETSHSLRGASASMGFPRVAILCKDLELAARALEKAADGPPGNNAEPVPMTSELARLLEQIRVHYFEAERAMESWMASNIGTANANIAEPNQ